MGSGKGSLYGAGLYFADSIVKADEYSEADENGVYSMLLCRVLGGNVLYSAEDVPDGDLRAQVLEGRYDSVLGDREQVRGTFKEYMVYDADHVYPAYEIRYRRVS